MAATAQGGEGGKVKERERGRKNASLSQPGYAERNPNRLLAHCSRRHSPALVKIEHIISCFNEKGRNMQKGLDIWHSFSIPFELLGHNSPIIPHMVAGPRLPVTPGTQGPILCCTDTGLCQQDSKL